MDENVDDDDENVEYDEFDTPVNNKYKYGIYSKSVLSEQKGRGKIIENLILHGFVTQWLRIIILIKILKII